MPTQIPAGADEAAASSNSAPDGNVFWSSLLSGAGFAAGMAAFGYFGYLALSVRRRPGRRRVRSNPRKLTGQEIDSLLGRRKRK